MGKKSGIGTEIAGRQGPVALRLSVFPITLDFISSKLTLLPYSMFSSHYKLFSGTDRMMLWP